MTRAGRAAAAGPAALAAVAVRDRLWPNPSVPCAATCSRSPRLREVYGYERGWGMPSASARAEIARIMTGEAVRGGSAQPSETAVG